ncbi:hypothetical protein B0H19DRAFT_1139862 [Mycena capillaripes]|nr:hypothetical protein B0H19DRAFT_1139862 [Mycena capillaripes]
MTSPIRKFPFWDLAEWEVSRPTARTLASGRPVSLVFITLRACRCGAAGGRGEGVMRCEVTRGCTSRLRLCIHPTTRASTTSASVILAYYATTTRCVPASLPPSLCYAFFFGARQRRTYLVLLPSHHSLSFAALYSRHRHVDALPGTYIRSSGPSLLFFSLHLSCLSFLLPLTNRHANPFIFPDTSRATAPASPRLNRRFSVCTDREEKKGWMYIRYAL